jgi:hypothetical protein
MTKTPVFRLLEHALLRALIRVVALLSRLDCSQNG